MNKQVNNSTNSQCSTTDTFIRRHNASEGAESIITTDSSGAQTSTIELLEKTINDANNLIKKPENELLKLGSVEDRVQLCEQHLIPSLCMFAKNNMFHNGKKVIMKQSLKEKYLKKQLALTLYFFGPEVLHFFKKSFNLPSLNILKKNLY
ncbi:uncharacterized protein LOC113549830 [Rhopalosiphum maidis]|uniref:uncharacterized protein LOC113549830 n=1 Tax=Rhopalosiphum maidis TaxID=43146 RepID=UPI000EFF5ECB|nr:uncharacterized protein LOC113549830 [Rhopalosiphum maidis]